MAIDPRESQRTELRKTFDSGALRYQRARPGYPREIFDLIADAGDLGPTARVLEVGAGTGQATRSMASRGWQVTAIELGESLAEVGRAELAEYDNVDFLTDDVETTELSLGQFGAVVAFTCFHWLHPDSRAQRLASLLRPGGLLAVVDTHHINNPDGHSSQPFFDQALSFYVRWMGPGHTRPLPTSEQIAPRLPLLVAPSLEPLTEHRVEHDITYTAQEYVDVLQTYSNHLALDAVDRKNLLSELAHLIDNRYDGTLTKRHLYTVALARRSSSTEESG